MSRTSSLSAQDGHFDDDDDDNDDTKHGFREARASIGGRTPDARSPSGREMPQNNNQKRKFKKRQVNPPPGPRAYQRPYSEEGQWLSFDVPLRTMQTSRHDAAFSGSKCNTTTTCIAAATQRSSEESVVIELLRTEAGMTTEDTKWIHVQDPETTLDGFHRLVYSISGVRDDEVILAERMFYDLKSKRTSRLTNFKSVSPGTVLRYDSRDRSGHESEGDCSVTFLSIPYFLTKRASEHHKKGSPGTQTLLESLYPLERTESRDHGQIFSLYNSGSNGGAIYVSQTFVLVFSKVLLTYSESSDSTIRGSVLRHVDSKRRAALARIVSPAGDVFHIDIDPTPSYFTFLEQVRVRCFGYEHVDDDQIELFFENGTQLNATSWLEHTESSSNAVVTIQARSRLLQSPPPQPYPPEPLGLDTDDRKLESLVATSSPQRGRLGARGEHRSLARPRVRFETPGQMPSKNDPKAVRRSRESVRNGPTHRERSVKPEIYHLPHTALGPKPSKPQLVIGSTEVPDLTNKALYEHIEPVGNNKYEWGFLWEGKFQSELRDAPAPPYMPLAPPWAALTSEHLDHRTPVREYRTLEWHNGRDDAPEEMGYPNQKSLVIWQNRDDHQPAPSERHNDVADFDRFHWRSSSSTVSSRTGSIDSSDRLALVPFKRGTTTGKFQNAHAHIASQQPKIREPSRRDQKLLGYSSWDASSSDPTTTFNSENFERGEIAKSGSQQDESRLPTTPIVSFPTDDYFIQAENENESGLLARDRTRSRAKVALDAELSQMKRERDPSPHSRRYESSDNINVHPQAGMYPSNQSHRGAGPISRGHIRNEAIHRKRARDLRSEAGYLPPSRSAQSKSMSRTSRHWQDDRLEVGFLCQEAAGITGDFHKEFIEDRRKLYARKVPPFFSWVGGTQLLKDAMLPDITKLESILRIIDEKLASEVDKKQRKIYRKAREKELRDFEASRPRVSNAYSLNCCLTAFGADSRFVRLQKQRHAVDDVETEDVLSILTSAQDYCSRTVELFLPAIIKGRPLLKLWGALDVYTQILQNNKLREDNSSPQHPERWAVKETERCVVILQNLPISLPLDFGRECWCKEPVFSSRADAINHLLQRHVRKGGSKLFPHTLLKYFVTTAASLLAKSRLYDLLNSLKHFHSFLCDFHGLLEDLMLGVAKADQSQQTELQLTVSLMDCFEKFLLAHAKAANLFTVIDQHYRLEFKGVNIDQQDYQITRSRLDDELDQWCSSTLETAKTAYHEIVILSRAETHVSAIQLSSVGLPSIVAGLLSAAQSTVFNSSEDIVMQYDECVSSEDIVMQYDECVAKLQYRVNQHPRKKLLHHIHHLGEELASVRQTIETSKILLRNYARTLRPESYRKTDRSRTILNPIEDDYLKRTYRATNGQLHALRHLERRSQHLVAQVKRSVEILEEDHGKAILTFTIITTIFLPLSFVTSFLGMNTFDIRNMKEGQWVFWGAAIPFTTIVACLVLVVAFKGGDTVEAIGGFGNLAWQTDRLFSSAGKATSLMFRRTPKRTNTDLTLESAMDP